MIDAESDWAPSPPTTAPALGPGCSSSSTGSIWHHHWRGLLLTTKSQYYGIDVARLRPGGRTTPPGGSAAATRPPPSPADRPCSPPLGATWDLDVGHRSRDQPQLGRPLATGDGRHSTYCPADASWHRRRRPDPRHRVRLGIATEPRRAEQHQGLGSGGPWPKFGAQFQALFWPGHHQRLAQAQDPRHCGPSRCIGAC